MLEHLRSPLFVPGNRPDMLIKACGVDADALVPDMEDSVRPEDKPEARATIRRMLPELVRSGKTIIPRINPLGSEWAAADLEGVIGPDVPAISVGKIAAPEDLAELDVMLTRLERAAGLPIGHTRVLPWLESAYAMVHAHAVLTATERVVIAAFGADDYAADMGLVRSRDPRETRYAKAALGMAARAAGVRLLDSPCTHFRDLTPLEQEIDEVRPLGFHGKFAIHPAQVPMINRHFAPSPEAVAWAQRILTAWRSAPPGRGALNLDGTMVDEPLVKQAERILGEARTVDGPEQGSAGSV